MSFSPRNISFSREEEIIDFDVNSNKSSYSFSKNNDLPNLGIELNKIYDNDNDNHKANHNDKENKINKEKEEYLKCEKCKKKAEIMYKNNFYCQICYSNIFSNSINNDIYKRKITLNE